MNEFQAVIEAVKQKERKATEERQRQEAFGALLAQKRDRVIDELLHAVLRDTGIDGVVRDHKIVAGEFELSLDIPPSKRYDEAFGIRYAPLNLKFNGERMNLDDWVLNTQNLRLLLTNTALAEEYRARRPNANQPYADYKVPVHATLTEKYRDALSLAIGEAVLYLTQEAEEAPTRKHEIDARWEAEQAEREEARKREAQEREQQKARREAEQKAQEAQEAKYRAEIAAKFDVSVGAFDYLIERLADELARRGGVELIPF